MTSAPQATFVYVQTRLAWWCHIPAWHQQHLCSMQLWQPCTYNKSKTKTKRHKNSFLEHLASRHTIKLATESTCNLAQQTSKITSNINHKSSAWHYPKHTHKLTSWPKELILNKTLTSRTPPEMQTCRTIGYLFFSSGLGLDMNRYHEYPRKRLTLVTIGIWIMKKVLNWGGLLIIARDQEVLLLLWLYFLNTFLDQQYPRSELWWSCDQQWLCGSGIPLLWLLSTPSRTHFLRIWRAAATSPLLNLQSARSWTHSLSYSRTRHTQPSSVVVESSI